MIAVPISHATAVGHARGAVMDRMIEVAFSDRFLEVETDADGRGTRCRRVTARRFGCSYHFEVVGPEGASLYEEWGKIRVTSNSVRLRVRRTSDDGGRGRH